MSFESAKKYGNIGSMIRIITPVIMIVVVVALLVAFFATIISAVGNILTPTFASSALLIGLFGTIFAIGVVDLAGYILFLIAMNRLSQYYNEKIIFKNVLNALIIQIIVATVTFTVLIAWLFSNWTNLTAATSTSVPLLTRLSIYALIIPVSLAISIYCGLLYKRAFDKLSEKSGVDSFRTAGLLFLIGGIIGSLIIWIAWIFANSGFRKLSPTQQPPQSTYRNDYGQTSVTGTTKYCPACGAENSLDSLYCAKCGRQL
jgi:uncharacterized membrane protein